MKPSESFTSEKDAYSPVRDLVEKGLYLDALQALGAYPAFEFETLRIRLFILIDMGKLKEAAQVCEEALPQFSNRSLEHIEISLRRTFLELFLTGRYALVVRRLRELLSRVEKNPEAIYCCALAREHLARTLALGVSWSLAPETALLQSQQQFGKAVQAFKQIHKPAEMCSAYLALGQIFVSSTKPVPLVAKPLFETLVNTIPEDRFPLKRLEAMIALAEIQFDIDSSIEGFEQALEYALRHGVKLGHAHVQLSLAQRLSRHPHSKVQDGIAVAKEALSTFDSLKHLKGIYGTLSFLSAQLLTKGKLPEAKIYLDRAFKVSVEMGAPIFEAVTRLALSSYFLHSGSLAKALAESERVSVLASQFPSVASVGSLSLANCYFSLSQFDKAELACRNALRNLTKLGPQTSLSLAYFVLGNVYSGKNQWSNAIKAWQRALVVDRELGDMPAQVQKLQCLAFAHVMYQKERGLTAATKLLDEARRLLNAHPESQALPLIAGIEQCNGQLALMCGDVDGALKSLTFARSHFLKLQQSLQVAFVESQLGLLYYELGKQGNEQFLHQALFFQESAAQFFEQQQMHELFWRIAFHRALTAVRFTLNHPDPEEELKMLRQSVIWLHKAANSLEHLKSHGGAPSGMLLELKGAVSDQSKVYVLAVHILFDLLKNLPGAFQWLERKARFQTKNRDKSVEATARKRGERSVLDRGKDFLHALSMAKPESVPALDVTSYSVQILN